VILQNIKLDYSYMVFFHRNLINTSLSVEQSMIMTLEKYVVCIIIKCQVHELGHISSQ